MMSRSLRAATSTGAVTASAISAAGRWREAGSGEVVEGGRVVERAMPIDAAPVWVRDADWERLRGVFGR